MSSEVAVPTPSLMAREFANQLKPWKRPGPIFVGTFVSFIVATGISAYWLFATIPISLALYTLVALIWALDERDVAIKKQHRREASAAHEAFQYRARQQFYALAQPTRLRDLDRKKKHWMVVHFNVDGVHLDCPLKEKFKRGYVFRAEEPGTEARVQFPRACVDSEGRITDYGNIVVLYGKPYPSLPLWKSERRHCEEAPYIWQVAPDRI